MDFEYDVYISYAHIDNMPLAPDQPGWITRFHETLSIMLSMRLGYEAKIWRDLKLLGNDTFADEAIQQFPKTALYLAVLSPRYVQSEWCTREVREFCKIAEQTGGILVDGKSRVVKVIKLPVADESPLPDVMKNTLGYPFYIFEEERALELDPAYGGEFAQKFNLQVARLAQDISAILVRLQKQ